jgi:hypothetical protein
MPAFFDNSATVEHHNSVSAENSTQPMRDDESRAALKQLLHRFFD